jgi:hypothetical protein
VGTTEGDKFILKRACVKTNRRGVEPEGPARRALRSKPGPMRRPFLSLWLANRALLQTWITRFPPLPVLFLNLVLMFKPARFKQLFAKLWVTDTHTRPQSFTKNCATDQRFAFART